MRTLTAAILILFLGVLTLVESNELYLFVSNENGSDDLGDGSIVLPFQTIKKALQSSSESTTIYVYYGWYYEDTLNITQSSATSLKIIGIEDGVYLKATITSSYYIHLRIEKLHLYNEKMALDIMNIQRLEIVNSVIEGYVMVVPFYYNKFMLVSLEDSIFTVKNASSDVVFFIQECNNFLNAVNNSFDNSTLTIKRRCINDIGMISNIHFSKNRFYFPDFPLFMEHTSSGYPYFAITYHGKKDTYINASHNFWADPLGPKTCCNHDGMGSVVNLNIDYQHYCADPHCKIIDEKTVDIKCINEGCIQKLSQPKQLIMIISSVLSVLCSFLGSIWMSIAYTKSDRGLQESLNFYTKALINGVVVSISTMTMSCILIMSTNSIMVQIHAERISGFAYVGAYLTLIISCIIIAFSLFALVLIKKEKNGFIIFHRTLKPFFVIKLASMNILLLKLITESLFYANFYRWKVVIELSPLTYYTYPSTLPLILTLSVSCLSSWKVKDHIFKSDIKKIKQHVRQNPLLLMQEDVMQKSPELDKEAMKTRISLYISLGLWLLFTGFSITFTLLSKAASTLNHLNVLLSVISSTGVALLIITIVISYKYNQTSALLSILLVSMVHTILAQAILISWGIAFYGVKNSRDLAIYVVGIILPSLCIISKIVDSIRVHFLRQKVSAERYRLILSNITAIEHQSLLTQ